MRKARVFENVSLDGFFTDAKGGMSWAHKQDEEWNTSASDNASGNGELLFGSPIGSGRSKWQTVFWKLLKG
jgi:hypothetical protein